MNEMEEAGDPKLLCDYQWGEQQKHDLKHWLNIAILVTDKNLGSFNWLIIQYVRKLVALGGYGMIILQLRCIIYINRKEKKTCVGVCFLDYTSLDEKKTAQPKACLTQYREEENGSV